MDELAGFLRDQRSGGHHSEGVFTIDPSKARELLRQFQLPDPAYALLKAVQAAVAWGSPEIRISSSSAGIFFEFEPDASLEEAELWPAKLLDPLRIGHPAERHLALAMLGALDFANEMVLSYDLNGQRQTLRIANQSLNSSSALANGRPVQLSFHGLGGRDKIGRSQLQLLRERCEFCPSEVLLDGVSLRSNFATQDTCLLEACWRPENESLPGLSIAAIPLKTLDTCEQSSGVWRGKTTGHWPLRKSPRTRLYYSQDVQPSHETGRWKVQMHLRMLRTNSPVPPSRLIAMVDGVCLETVAVDLPLHCQVVVEDSSLSLDLSGFQIVRNSTFDALVDRLKRQVEEMLSLVWLHPDLRPLLPDQFRVTELGLPRLFGPCILFQCLSYESPKTVFRAVRASHTQEIDPVVLTTFSDGAGSELFLRKVHERSLLKHSCFPLFLEHGEIEGIGFLVDAWADGRPLQTMISSGPTETVVARDLLCRLGRLLAELHSQNMLAQIRLHPECVLVDGDTLWLTDLGPTLSDYQSHHYIQPHYEPKFEELVWCSPDFLMSTQASAAGDQYTLGALGYGLVTGRPPFLPESQNAMAIFIEIFQSTPPDPREFRPDLPDELAEALLRSLEKDPDKRFPSVADFVEAIESAKLDRP